MADLATLVTRARPDEFTDTQRPLFELLIHIRSGTTSHEVDFQTHHLQAGDVLWVHSGQVQRWGRVDALEATICMFDETLFDAATDQLLRGCRAFTQTHWANVARPGSPLAQAFSLLLRRQQDIDAQVGLTAAASAHAMAAVALDLLATSQESPTPGSGAHPADELDERMPQFRRAVECHFATDRSVRSYARRLGWSERTLHRVVLGSTGITPKEIISERVVLEAKRLLVHGGTSVEMIARTLGFEDQSNFTKFFKKAVGVAPREFRRTHT